MSQHGRLESEPRLSRIRSGRAAALAICQAALERRTASDVAVLALTVVVCLGAGSTLVGGAIAFLAIVAGVTAAGATVLLASERPLVRVGGGLIAGPVGLLVLSPTALAVDLVGGSGVSRTAGIAVWAMVLAAFAAGLLGWHRLGEGGVRRGATGAILAAVGVVGVAIVRIVPESTARDRLGVAVADTGAWLWNGAIIAEGSLAMLTFAGMGFLSTALLGYALNYVALERFVPPDRRVELSAVVSRLERGCRIGRRVAILTAVVAVVLPGVLDTDGLILTPAATREILPPIGAVLAAIVTASSLRVLFVALLIVAVGSILLEWLRRAIGREVARTLVAIVAPAVGGGAVALVLGWLLSGTVAAVDPAAGLEGRVPVSVVELVASVPSFALATGVLAVGLSSLASVSITVATLRGLRILPARAIGAALAAGAVFVLAFGLAVVGQVELSILTGAAGFVIWDVGEYGDSVRRELGPNTDTFRAELVHLGGSLLSGIVVAIGTIALWWLVADVAVTDSTTAAVALASGVLAVSLVAWVLRG